LPSNWRPARALYLRHDLEPGFHELDVAREKRCGTRVYKDNQFGLDSVLNLPANRWTRSTSTYGVSSRPP